MVNTQRFNSNKNWWAYNGQANSPFMGLTHLINDLVEHFKDQQHSKKMIEIGSYMGESTFLFGCSGIFHEINAIDPHEGEEPFNDDFDITWDKVKKELDKCVLLCSNCHKETHYELEKLKWIEW